MVLVQCRKCRQPKEVGCTPEQYKRWEEGALIQVAMPDVPPDERKLLISGICGKCFDELFPLRSIK